MTRPLKAFAALGAALLMFPDVVWSASPETVSGSRLVRYGARDVIPLYTQLRYTTLIVLPAEERILDFVCGDREFWIVNGNQNLAYVKPARSGARSNLNLIAASGNVYSFLLTEVSELRRDPDLKVYVELEEPSMASAAAGRPAFVAALEVDNYRVQLDLAREEGRKALAEADARADASIASFRSSYPVKLRFTYRVRTREKPFLVTAMFHDDRFTFIQARSSEPPAVYELRDGKPNLVDYDYRDGAYIVSRILDRGYLAIGKRRLPFERIEDDGEGSHAAGR